MLRVKICGLTMPQDAAAAIEFGVENPLPRTQIEFALGDRHNHFMVDQ